MVANNILPVTDPVESNYALTAKEMVLSGNWLSPQIYGTYWYDKPIMIYWLIALAFKIFGIADWVVRLPSAIFGALSVAAMFQTLRTFSRRWLVGLVGSSILGTSLMFWAVAHGVITDMVLLYTTLMVMMYAYKGLNENSSTANGRSLRIFRIRRFDKGARSTCFTWPYFTRLCCALPFKTNVITPL